MRSKFTVFAWLAVAAATRALSFGQCEPRWLPLEPSAVLSGVTCSALWDPDGSGPGKPRLILGGSFTSGWGVPANRIIAFDLEMLGASSMGAGSSTPVTAVLVTRSNALYACGTFTDSFATSSYGMWRWTGSAWERQGEAISGTIEALTESAAGDIVAVGSISRIGSTSVGRVVRWDGAEWLDAGFGSIGTVRSICLEPNGDLLVAGSITSAGGTPASSVARLSGNVWSAHATGIVGTVNSVLSHTDGRVFVGGRVTLAGESSSRNVAVWNGASWSGAGQQLNGEVLKLIELPDRRVLATGTFRVGVSGVSAVVYNGSAWEEVGPESVGRLSTASVLSSGAVIMPGADVVARWDGKNLAALSRGPSFGNLVHTYGSCLEPLTDGSVLLGGLFTSAGGSRVGNVARWDGVRWHGLSVGVSGQLFPSVPAEVVAIAATSKDDVYVAGYFTRAGDSAASGVAHWDGRAWRALGSGSTEPIRALALLPDGSLVAGGEFKAIGGVPASRVARWNGAEWASLGAGFDSTVNDLAVLDDGTLVASGSFTRTGLQAVNGVAAWDGTKWVGLGLGVSSGAVAAMSVAANGDLLVAGTFLSAGDGPARRVARWEGSTWSKIGDGLGGSFSDARVLGIAALPDGGIVAAGYLPYFNSGLGHTPYRWNGSTWSQIPGPSGTGPRTIAFHARSGEIICSGWYQGVFARYADVPAPWIAYQPLQDAALRSETVELSATPATGYSNVSFQWKRETTPGVFVDVINGVGGSGGVSGDGAGGTVSGASGSLASPTDGTAAVLTINNATPADTGNYKVLFWNTCGEVESVAVKVRVKGHAADINGDGLVDDEDFTLFALQYNTMLCSDPEMPDACSADFNADGQVDDADFNILAPAYNVMMF
ncbi:MAG TPA: hypothetical protein VF777_08735 [Phycisphaerales bacterium]